MVTKRTPIAKVGPVALPELEQYLAPYASLFQRGQTRRSLERYVSGLLTDLKHKTCDTISQAVAGTSTERLQNLLVDADWDSAALDEARVRRLAESSPQGGILLLDGTDQVKQGHCSVGVARQYSGSVGKIANCQVMVTSQYMANELGSSQPLHWPVTARLYVPEAWINDSERRKKAHIPDDLEFRTKSEIALDLIDQARTWGVPFQSVVADAGFGDNPAFLAGLEERRVSYACGVESTFGLRLPEEVQSARDTPPAKHQGKGRPKLPRPAPLHLAKALAEALPDKEWHTITWREGTKGPLRKQFAAVRAHRATGNPTEGRPSQSRVSTGPEGWLLIERPLPGEKGDCKYYYSNLPADTPLERLVALAHARWVIEQFYREAKGECGLDNYQGRFWEGLHRHLALVMLSYSFLLQQRACTHGHAEGGLFPLRTRPDHPTRRAQTGLDLVA